MKQIFHSPFNEDAKVKPIWKQYYELIKLFFSLNYLPAEYYLFKFDDKNCGEKDMLQYLPYSWFLREVNNEFTKNSWKSLFKNKYEFEIYAAGKGLKVPKSYGIYNKLYGFDFDDNSSLSNLSELEGFLKRRKLEKIVFKDLCGKQGQHIHFVSDILFSQKETTLIIDNQRISLKDFIKELGNGEFLVQEQLENDEFLNSIYPNSLNTFRIITYYSTKQPAKILGALLRTGIGENKVDNWHRGGLIIPIKLSTGCFTDYGYDYHYNVYTSHPDTQFIFRETKIPYWEEITSIVINATKAFPMMKFVAWDIALTTRGYYILEANAGQINIFVNQLSGNGIAGIIREDLKEYGCMFPEKKIPPVTIDKITQRLMQVIKNIF